ncbi:MAG: hypothetical protein ABS99_09415 [Acetobacteraceae bacterium SCN 69-10]|nr:MAG: hypothetical protein ABS99_09415 [Acetobacteraceae bacterium SCN 69-10]
MKLSTATITSQLIKLGAMRTRSPLGVRPLNPARCRFVAPAVTLRYAPMREDLDGQASIVHPHNPTRLAVETTPAGSVLMIDQGGDLGGGALGDILVARLIRRGVAAVVGDGAMRDAGPLMAMAMPVFARSFTPPPSSASILAVGFQEPIGCGGTLVYPGDIVVGDEDGVVVIPRHLADKVATAGLEQERVEVFIKRRVELGEPIAGFYPATERTMAEYNAWKASGSPEL